MGWRTIGFAEIDPFASRVLAKNFPGVIPGIMETSDLFPMECGADIITAGIPCQPYSCAGKRMGHEDDRAIWPVALSGH
jgi:DNA (cytosine-5)-methyltransferase 1